MQGPTGSSTPNKLVYLNERTQNRAGSFDEARSVLAKVLPMIDLNKIQELVFCHCWVGDSYPEIARMSDYDADYIKDVGYRLWRQLSDALQEPVNKQNFRTIFKQRFQQVLASQAPPQSPLSSSLMPSGGFNPLSNPVVSQVATLTLPCIDWGEAGELTGFVGRKAELEQLNHWLNDDKCRLIGLFGLGGIGKTALAIQFAEQNQQAFQFLIWRSLRNTPKPEALLQNLLQRLTSNPDLSLPESLEAQITLLIDYLRQYRCLLILDDWHALLKPGEFAGTYEEGYEAYGQLLRRIGESRHQSCLLFTSREKPASVTLLDDRTLPVRLLQVNGLKFKDSQALLNSLGLTGTNEDSLTQAHLEQLWRFYSGTPLSLKIVAKTILELFNGNVELFLNQKSFIYGQIRSLLEQQLQRLSPAESQVLQWLANQNEGSSLTELQSSQNLDIPQDRLLEVLESLDRRSLIRLKNGQFVIPRLPKAFLNLSDI